MVVLVCHAVTSLVTYDRDPDRHHSMVTHSDGGDGSMCSLNIQQQQPQARNVTQLVRCSRPIRKITRLNYSLRRQASRLTTRRLKEIFAPCTNPCEIIGLSPYSEYAS
jgi:hypothetical protein